MRQVTLCLLVKNNKDILLAMKKRGFGVGKWNGVGGKVADGESIEDAAVRETGEELGITISKKEMRKVANIEFTFKDKEEWNQEMSVYWVEKWDGEPKESEEMRPQWFSFDSIPFNSMWADDIHWLPIVLSGKKVRCKFLFNPEGQIICDNWEVKEVNNF